MGGNKKQTFPLHLALSMIFSANSFPVDLNRNSAIRGNNKNGTNAAAVSVSQVKCSQESCSYSEQQQCHSYWKRTPSLYSRDTVQVQVGSIQSN